MYRTCSATRTILVSPTFTCSISNRLRRPLRLQWAQLSTLTVRVRKTRPNRRRKRKRIVVVIIKGTKMRTIVYRNAHQVFRRVSKRYSVRTPRQHVKCWGKLERIAKKIHTRMMSTSTTKSREVFWSKNIPPLKLWISTTQITVALLLAGERDVEGGECRTAARRIRRWAIPNAVVAKKLT